MTSLPHSPQGAIASVPRAAPPAETCGFLKRVGGNIGTSINVKQQLVPHSLLANRASGSLFCIWVSDIISFPCEECPLWSGHEMVRNPDLARALGCWVCCSRSWEDRPGCWCPHLRSEPASVSQQMCPGGKPLKFSAVKGGK